MGIQAKETKVNHLTATLMIAMALLCGTIAGYEARERQLEADPFETLAPPPADFPQTWDARSYKDGWRDGFGRGWDKRDQTTLPSQSATGLPRVQVYRNSPGGCSTCFPRSNAAPRYRRENPAPILSPINPIEEPQGQGPSLPPIPAFPPTHPDDLPPSSDEDTSA